ncbi:MAG: pyridoxamine 5'-phosphate oxidase [Robiginitomaculum sp.]|nr:pyridoxamine 5'-phosphate oxidase [Robiginitomaculum sp.]
MKESDKIYKDQAKANTQRMFRADNPYTLFDTWMAEAKSGEPNDPNAMALATVDENGLPDVRMVLLKGVDERGFVFYSHAGSAKGGQLKHNPKAALNFHWKSLRRQVRVRGTVEPLTKLEVGKYFASRPRDSQIGAWASRQSETMKTRNVFEKAIDTAKDKFAGAAVPLPPGWNGWRVLPEQIEFWRDRPFRLHDRLLFEQDADSNAWTKRRLYP